MWGIRRSVFARSLAVFALVALGLRAFVPAGYMLSPDEEGRFITITICTLDGGGARVLDLASGQWIAKDKANPADPSNSRDGNDLCAFAMATAQTGVESESGLTVKRQALPVILDHWFDLAPGRGLAAPPPWSTGPPRTA
ncbi:MAG: hypothetical protein HXY22_00625 [Alphaproteobacteria bacterium]|nr:hypothetical protein [Alphaproteobacteria bacterium]